MKSPFTQKFLQSLAKKEYDLCKKSWVSLKLAHMFNTKKKFNDEWRETAIDDHLSAMLALINNHYEDTKDIHGQPNQ